MRLCPPQQSRQLVPSGGILRPAWNHDVFDQPAFQTPAPGPDVNLDPVLLHIRPGGQEQSQVGHGCREYLAVIRQALPLRCIARL